MEMVNSDMTSKEYNKDSLKLLKDFFLADYVSPQWQ
jgi:hypothetical protein